MIICRKCGNHNEDRDEFCVSCGAFLEWSGERVAQPAPPPPPEPEPPPPPPPPGLVERVKQAVGLEGQRGPMAASPPAADPPATAAPPATAGPPPTTDPGQKVSPPPPAGGGWAPPASLETGSGSGAGTPAPLEAPPASAAAPPAQPAAPPAREPQAVQPAAPRPRAVPRTTAPDVRHEPGDLICGQCGTGNRASRHFCQRCGASLAEAPVVRTPWYRRLFRPRRPPAAGDRRTTTDSTGTPAGSQVRRFVPAALTVAVVGGVLAYAGVPSVHRRVDHDASGVSTEVGRLIDPTYVPARPVQTTASSELAGHPASFATDLVSNDYWAANRTGDPQPTLAVRFAGPTDLDNMLIRSGAGPDYGRLARPRTVQVTYSDGTGQLLTLKDDPKPTSYSIHAGHVSSLTIQVTSVYPAAQSPAVAIAEVEFFRLR